MHGQAEAAFGSARPLPHIQLLQGQEAKPPHHDKPHHDRQERQIALEGLQRGRERRKPGVAERTHRVEDGVPHGPAPPKSGHPGRVEENAPGQLGHEREPEDRPRELPVIDVVHEIRPASGHLFLPQG